MDITTSFLYISTLLTCVDSALVHSRITVSARVGDTAVLACKLSNPSRQTTNVKWRNKNDTVFEQSVEGTYQGKGYEGRVDVPENKLLKGDCSLVLKDVRITDAGFYKSYMVIEKSKKWQPVSSVELSVDGKTGESSDKKLASSDETGESSDKTSGSSDYGIRNHYIIIFPVFLSLCLYCTRVRSWIRNLRCCLTINI